jgi:hypothetical protein
MHKLAHPLPTETLGHEMALSDPFDRPPHRGFDCTAVVDVARDRAAVAPGT